MKIYNVKNNKWKKYAIVLLGMIVSFISCEKDTNELNYEPKPHGKYLSEIFLRQYSGQGGDSLLFLRIEYNNKRFAERINYYNSINQISSYLNLSYNSLGKISKLQWFDSDNIKYKEEIISYQSDSVMNCELSEKDSNGWNLTRNRRVEFDLLGRPIKQTYFVIKDDVFGPSSTFPTYEYYENGNMGFYSWNYEDPESSFTFQYKYDNKINPFYEIGFDIIHGRASHAWGEFINYVPKNNMINFNLEGSRGDGYGSEYNYDDLYPIYEKYTPYEYFYSYVEL